MTDHMKDTRDMLQGAMSGLTKVFPGCGVVLLVFPQDGKEGERTNYVSNCSREDIKAAMREVLARWEGRAHDAPSGKQ